jgi:hypothetical protein
MATTHEPLHLDKRSFIQQKIMITPKSFIWTIIFFREPFEYGDGWIFNVSSRRTFRTTYIRKQIMHSQTTKMGVEGIVRGLEGTHLADRCILTKLE